MHRVVQSHLNGFKEEFSLDYKESRLFEAFSAYCIAKQFTFESVDPEALTYEGADPGIDSAFFIVNDQVVTTISEAEKVFLLEKLIILLNLYLCKAKLQKGGLKQRLTYSLLLYWISFQKLQIIHIQMI